MRGLRVARSHSKVDTGTNATTGDSLQKGAKGYISAINGDAISWADSGPQQGSLEQTILIPRSIPQGTRLQFMYAINRKRSS